jgi:dihydroorotate dehydrogenase (fumarate)
VAAVDLSTSYLGLRLANPFMAGASPLGDHLDTVRRLEDAGCAAIVLHSLFEEQVSDAASGRVHHLNPSDPQFADVLSYFPEPAAYTLTPDAYLEHLRRVKDAVKIPVIASLNGVSPEAWLKFALRLEQAGADALELNVYEIATDPDDSAASIEHALQQMVKDLRVLLKIPIAVKLSPYFTALANVARTLDRAGASGLVIFNRFMQPDIDLTHLAVWPRLDLSTSAELLLRVRWLAILRGHVRCSLAATGGVATPEDGIKALLAGADAVQLVSAILRHGPSYFVTMRAELRRWMEDAGFDTLHAIRGVLSLAGTPAPAAFERAQYMRTLSGWSGWLSYQAYVRDRERKAPKAS